MNNKVRHEVYKKPKLLRRICASIIDMIIVFSLTIILNLLFSNAYKNFSSYKDNMKAYTDFVVSTNMYYYDNDGIATQNKDYLIDEDYEEFIIKYITDGTKEVENIKNDFNNQSEITSYNDYIEDKVYSTYINKAVKNNEVANNASNKLAGYYYLSIVLAILVSCLLTYLLVPIINKKGKTIGKLLFHLRIISCKGQVDVRKIQIIFRELVKTILEFIASVLISLIIFIPIPLIVSLVIMLFNKNQQSLHDIICSTIVVDEDIQNDIKENEKIILTIVDNKEDSNGK